MPDTPAVVPAWVRVRSKAGAAHEYDVAGSSFDPDLHVRVNRRNYPDLLEAGTTPRPATYRTDKAGKPVPTPNQEP